MVKTFHKSISFDKFMKLWENVENSDGDAIFPNLPEKIRDKWKDELIIAFNMAKSRRTWGHMTLDEVASIARTFQIPPKTVGYSSRAYMKRYPDTYKKTGELYAEMSKQSPYQLMNFGTNNYGGLKITIPFKRRNITEHKGQYAYRWLEDYRSFLKGSFLHAWPKIFELVIDMIGK